MQQYTAGEAQITVSTVARLSGCRLLRPPTLSGLNDAAWVANVGRCGALMHASDCHRLLAGAGAAACGLAGAHKGTTSSTYRGAASSPAKACFWS